MVLAVRDVRDLWPGHVQRDTTSDGMLAFGHSRSGITQALVAQQAEQPPCKRQAARSNRRRGHQTRRVRLAGKDTGLSFRVRGFKSRTRHQSTEAFVELTLRGRKSAARLGGAGTRDRMECMPR